MDWASKDALLSTGVRVPLTMCALVLLLLDSLVTGGLDDRALLATIRRAALTGEPIEGRDREVVREAGMADEAGHLNSAVRSVVLAAVRGDTAAPQMVSPYTDQWDRAVSEFLVSREKVRVLLTPEQFEGLMRGSLDPSHPAPEPPGAWLNFVLRRRTDPNLPPPSAN